MICECFATRCVSVGFVSFPVVDFSFPYVRVSMSLNKAGTGMCKLQEVIIMYII